MTGTPCNFLSSQDGKVNTSKILFALAIESNLVEERLGKMTMVQTKKIILKECYSTNIVICFICLLFSCLFVQFEIQVQDGEVNMLKILFRFTSVQLSITYFNPQTPPSKINEAEESQTLQMVNSSLNLAVKPFYL